MPEFDYKDVDLEEGTVEGYDADHEGDTVAEDDIPPTEFLEDENE